LVSAATHWQPSVSPREQPQCYTQSRTLLVSPALATCSGCPPSLNTKGRDVTTAISTSSEQGSHRPHTHSSAISAWDVIHSWSQRKQLHVRHGNFHINREIAANGLCGHLMPQCPNACAYLRIFKIVGTVGGYAGIESCEFSSNAGTLMKRVMNMKLH